MSARAIAYVAAVLLGASSPTVAAPSWAATGGAGLSPRHGTNVATTAGRVQPADLTVSATDGGISISTRMSAMLHGQFRFTGAATATAAGKRVEIERLGRETRYAWAPTASATISPDGSFTATWSADHIGRFSIRAVIDSPAHANRAVSGAPTVTITVFRPALSTTFGTGFYGQTTACGEKLTRGMLGVANRTLPCGTPVALYYRGWMMVVPVIDRGPYANRADWDLTEATGQALGTNGTATIGAVSLPRS